MQKKSVLAISLLGASDRLMILSSNGYFLPLPESVTPFEANHLVSR